MESTKDPQLLFFDTFSHDQGEGLNLDLVQFPSPVIVGEVRVIPLKAKVFANFPGGGSRLGATNPSRFDLEFFANDLTKPGSSTFESLGTLKYNSSSLVALEFIKNIPTDGLVLRGLYGTLTLAVYGVFSKLTPEQLALQGSTANVVQSSIIPNGTSAELMDDDMSDISDEDIPEVRNDESDMKTLKTSLKFSRFVREIEELSDDNIMEWTDDEEIDPAIVHDDEPEAYYSDLQINRQLDIPMTPLRFFTMSKGESESGGASAALTEIDLDKFAGVLETSSINGEWVEHLEVVTSNIGPLLDRFEDARDRLMDYVEIGLDLKKSLAQPMPTFKVRHIKSGLKLVLTLLEDESHVQELFNLSVSQKLLTVFKEEYMAISIRLLIIRIMDCLLNAKGGVQHFLDKGLYEEILRLCCRPKLATRAKFGLTALLGKIHLHESLQRIIFLASRTADQKISPDEILEISELMDEIKDVYINAKLRISQAKLYLPVSSTYDLPEKNFFDPYPGFFKLLELNGTLRCCGIFLSCPKVSAYPGPVNSILRLIETLSSSWNGLVFFGNDPSATNLLVDSLIAYQGSSLGSSLLYKCHSTFLLDQIYGSCYGLERSECELPEVLSALRDLCSFSLSPEGKIGLSKVLALKDNMEILLKLCKHGSESKKDMKKSAIRGYSIELISLCIKMSDNLDYIKTLGSGIFLDLIKSDESSRLFELLPWFEIFESLPGDPFELTEECLPILCQIIKNASVFPSPSLLMALRLLRSITIPDEFQEKENVHKLKYYYLSIFSNDILEHFLNILCQINSKVPYLDPLNSNIDGYLLMSVLSPILRISKNLIRYLLSCRQLEHQDIRIIEPLMKTYSLISTSTPAYLCHSLSETGKSDILDIFLSFTAPEFDATKHKVSETPWKKTVDEILKYTLSCPGCFQSGLTVLSELLPLPLPIRGSSSKEFHSYVLNLRTLWSGHLFSLETKLAELFSVCAGTSGLIQTLFKKVIVQITDLSCHSASVMAIASFEALKSNSECPETLNRTFKLLEKLTVIGTFKSGLLSTVSCDMVNWISSSTLIEGTNGLRIIKNLCDPTISLNGKALFPPKDTIEAVCRFCHSFLGKPQAIEETLYLSLDILSSVSDCEIGSYFLKKTFFQSKGSFKTLFSHFETNYDPSTDNMSLYKVLDLLKKLTTGEDSCLSMNELSYLLEWKSNDSDPVEQHPLKLLKNKAVNELKEILNCFVQEFDELSSKDDKDIELSLSFLCDNEPSFPEYPTLQSQFESRTIFIDGGNPADLPEYFEEQMDEEKLPKIVIEYSDLVASYLPKEFNLVEEFNLGRVTSPSFSGSKKKAPGSGEKDSSSFKSKPIRNRNSSFHRGGGGGTQGNRSNNNRFNRNGQRNDSFRSRPPNTSRPPSLHVDDFLVLQSRGQQPTGPTGYNRQSVKAAKELFAQREAGGKQTTSTSVSSSSAPGGNGGSQSGEPRRNERSRPQVNDRGRNNGRGGGFRSNRNNSANSSRFSPEGGRFANAGTRRNWTDRNVRSKDRFQGNNRNSGRNRDDSRHRHSRSVTR